MMTEERMIVREGARYWWVFLVSGIAWLVIAWLVLRLNQTSITAVGVLARGGVHRRRRQRGGLGPPWCPGAGRSCTT